MRWVELSLWIYFLCFLRIVNQLTPWPPLSVYVHLALGWEFDCCQALDLLATEWSSDFVANTSQNIHHMPIQEKNKPLPCLTYQPQKFNWFNSCQEHFCQHILNIFVQGPLALSCQHTTSGTWLVENTFCYRDFLWTDSAFHRTLNGILGTSYGAAVHQHETWKSSHLVSTVIKWNQMRNCKILEETPWHYVLSWWPFVQVSKLLTLRSCWPTPNQNRITQCVTPICKANSFGLYQWREIQWWQVVVEYVSIIALLHEESLIHSAQLVIYGFSGGNTTYDILSVRLYYYHVQDIQVDCLYV